MESVDVEIMKLVEICSSNLKNSKECMNYLNERKISTESIKLHKLGYFPRNIDMLKKHVSKDVLKKLSIINFSEYCKFSDKYYLIFPIFSEYNIAIGIGGRTLMSDDERSFASLPKYENSSFKKSQNLYGLNLAKDSILKKNNTFIVEGYFDCISLHQNGITNSVAICGTAFSKQHLLKLLRYTDTLTFMLDRDEAGQFSARKIYDRYINMGIKIRLVLLPEGYKDVDEYFSSGKTKKDFYKELELYIPEW